MGFDFPLRCSHDKTHAGKRLDRVLCDNSGPKIRGTLTVPK